MTLQTMIDRLALAFKLTYSDRSLKYFPPEFNFRRPELSLLRKVVNRGQACYLTLYRIEFAELKDEVPEEIWTSLQESCRRHLKLAVFNIIGDRNTISLNQYSKTDFVLNTFTDESKQSGALVPDSLRSKLEEIRSMLEIGLSGHIPQWRNCLQISISVVPISEATNLTSLQRSLHEAYQFAVAMMTGLVTSEMEALRKQLLQVLDNGDISVLAQPIMNLTSGDVYGWEILTRGPVHSILHYPDELFRFASQTKLLSKLEFLVVKRALEEIESRRIHEPIFLNVTAVTLSHPLFLAHVLKCLQEHPSLSAAQIYFEITERHEVTNFKAMFEILRTYREHGFRFAVDDTGSGYSSLQWIGELVPELIKIDRSVIQHVDRYAIKESLLKAIVTAAKEMNCELVAEGVEREEEADVLFRLDVQMGQGFYFAKPNVLLHKHERDIFFEMKEKIQTRREQFAF